MGFPGSSDSKESASNVDWVPAYIATLHSTQVDQGSISGSRRSPGEGNGYPLQYSCLGNSMDRPAAAAAKSLQSCPTLCDPTDGSPSGSSVPGILQARTLEWVAISFSDA